MNCPKPLCDGTTRTVTESDTGYEYLICDRCSTQYHSEELDFLDHITECVEWLWPRGIDHGIIGEMLDDHEANDELVNKYHAFFSGDGGSEEPQQDLIYVFWRYDNNGVLDNIVLNAADNALPERPSALKRAEAADAIAHSLPENLKESFLQATQDIYATNTGDLHDLEFHLRMEQLFAKHTNRENDDERRELWDEILKYTHYAFDAKWMDKNTDKSRRFSEEAWKQNATPWRNGILTDKINSTRDDVDMDYVTVTPKERRHPQFDPLPDLESFVYYEPPSRLSLGPLAAKKDGNYLNVYHEGYLIASFSDEHSEAILYHKDDDEPAANIDIE